MEQRIRRLLFSKSFGVSAMGYGLFDVSYAGETLHPPQGLVEET